MRQPPPSLHDLDALFAPPTAEEIAEAWASLATDFGAGPLELLGEPIQEDGVTAQFFHYASAGLISLWGPLPAKRHVRRPLSLAAGQPRWRRRPGTVASGPSTGAWRC